MKKMSLADAKAHISELVDRAEHHGERIIILRHGKPAAAIVPAEAAKPKTRRRTPMTEREVRRSVRAFVDEFSGADPGTSAVEDLIQGRR